MAATQGLQTEEEQVLTANRTFYAALHKLDLSLMTQVWMHAEWVKCLHPGWELLIGWDYVRGSWEEIFRSTEQMMVSVTRPLVHVAGNAAWVCCLESVTTASQNNVSSTLIEATNIFLRRDGRWLMVHHHTTPLTEPPPEATAPVQ